MSFQTQLEKLRSKPDHIRKRYAFLISFGITAIIFVFWIGTFRFDFNQNNQGIAKITEQAQTPSQSLVASVGSFFGDIKDIIFGPKKVEYTTIEIKPGRK